MMFTGMRPGEVLHLQWDRVDTKAGFIRLKAEDTKTGEPRNIAISKPLMDVLTALPRSLTHNHAFLYNGLPMNNIRQSTACACKDAKDAGIVYGRYVEGGFILHDIRRTVKTNMLEAKVDKSYRDLILGHALQGMDRHYVKPKEDRLTTAMARYTAWLEEKIASVDQNVDQVASENS